jgi:hypothetical protein
MLQWKKKGERREKFYRHGGGDNFGEQKLKNPKPKLIPALGRPSLGETRTPLCYCSRLPISLQRSSLSLFEPPLSLSKQATTHSPSSSPSQGCPLPWLKTKRTKATAKPPASPHFPSPETSQSLALPLAKRASGSTKTAASLPCPSRPPSPLGHFVFPLQPPTD